LFAIDTTTLGRPSRAADNKKSPGTISS